MAKTADDNEAEAITANPYSITNGEVIALARFRSFLSLTSPK